MTGTWTYVPYNLSHCDGLSADTGIRCSLWMHILFQRRNRHEEKKQNKARVDGSNPNSQVRSEEKPPWFHGPSTTSWALYGWRWSRFLNIDGDAQAESQCNSNLLANSYILIYIIRSVRMYYTMPLLLPNEKICWFSPFWDHLPPTDTCKSWFGMCVYYWFNNGF